MTLAQNPLTTLLQTPFGVSDIAEVACCGRDERGVPAERRGLVHLRCVLNQVLFESAPRSVTAGELEGLSEEVCRAVHAWWDRHDTPPPEAA
jgi:hypothetical protein